MESMGQVAVARTRERLSNKVGYTDKDRHILVSPARALRYLEERGGTIDFDANSVENLTTGLKTIWQKGAYDMCLDATGNPVARPTTILRCKSAERHAPMLARGFYAARRHLMADFHQPLFIVPRLAESKIIQVITYDPDYVVNGIETAATIAMKRGNRAMRNNLKVWMDRYQAMTGAREEITRRFHDIVEEIGGESLPPRRLALDFSE